MAGVTPHLAGVLRGAFGMMAAQRPEFGAEFNGAQVGAAALLVFLAAQELDKVDALAVENAEFAGLLAAAARDGYHVEAAAEGTDEARNAALRRSLIVLHAAVDRRDDRGWNGRLVAAYAAMAQRWRIDLPG